MTNIHPTAIIEKSAEIGKNCHIGAYSIIGSNVKIGDGCHLHAHVVISGHTSLGVDCEIFSFASLGGIPQDLKYEGEDSQLIIGDRNRIREHVTINLGTKSGGLITSLGNDCLIMAGCHIAHDCRLGNHVIMATHASLAGHVEIGDYAILGGLSGVHQFVRIGEHSMIGGLTGIENDIPPYTSATGDRGRLAGLNVIGLKRRGFDHETRHALRDSYQELFFGEAETFAERIDVISERYKDCQPVRDFLEFVGKKSHRSIIKPKINGN